MVTPWLRDRSISSSQNRSRSNGSTPEVIRSAQTAVYRLLGLKREPPAVYKGAFDPRVLFKAFMAMHDLHP